MELAMQTILPHLTSVNKDQFLETCGVYFVASCLMYGTKVFAFTSPSSSEPLGRCDSSAPSSLSLLSAREA